jgi:azurin
MQPATDLKASRPALEKLAAPGNAGLVRRTAIAALITADGSVDGVWSGATKSPAALSDFLEALPRVSDASLRGSAFDKVLPLLTTMPPEIAAVLSNKTTGSARYVRIELPRSGTLTLVEVQVFANGTNIGGGGVAKQSSTSNDGVAQRALDGNTNSDFNGGGQTHSAEGEANPWWEVDLKSDQAVSEIAVWNRAGFEERLEGFTLTVLDAGRNELFKKAGIPAPRPTTKIAIPHDPAAGVRAAAIRALVAMGKEPQKVFAGLAGLIQKNEEVPAAAKGISQLPREAWDKSAADPTAAALVNWAKKVPVEGRTTQDYSEVVQVANELAALLPPDRAAAARQVLRDLRVSVFVIKAVREQLRFDTKRLVVEAGKPFEVILENPDQIPHNIVFVQPGTLQAVAEAVQAQAPDKLDRQGRAYVPENDPRVFAASKMLEAGQKEALTITAPSKEGIYEYVCTFPGHWAVMQGKLVVTKDVDGYLKANPEVK